MSDQTATPNVEDLVAAARADLAARKERGEATPARPPRLSADEKTAAKASKAAERAKKKEEAAQARAQKKAEREAARAEKKAAREAERAAKAQANSDPVAVKASQELSVDQLKTALRLAKAALKAAAKVSPPAAALSHTGNFGSLTRPWVVKLRAFSYFKNEWTPLLTSRTLRI